MHSASGGVLPRMHGKSEMIKQMREYHRRHGWEGNVVSYERVAEEGSGEGRMVSGEGDSRLGPDSGG